MNAHDPEDRDDRDDRVDPRVLDAWTIEPLADDFADRVVAEAYEPRRPRWLRPSVAALVVGLAAALALLFFVRPWAFDTATPATDRRGTALATNTVETVEIAGRARVELQPGARLSWRVSEEGETRVRQDFGRARYEVEPGGPFFVDTPSGQVRVVGTAFTVEVMDMKQAHKRWSGISAVGAVGVATWVFVHYGEVEVINAEGSVAVGVDEEVLLTEDGPPRLLAPTPAPKPDLRSQRRRDRDETARRIRERLAERPRERPADEHDGDRADSDPNEPEEQTYLSPQEIPPEADYIRDVVRDQLVPAARTCYNEILAVDPELAGKIVLDFTVISDEEIGGVVDDVKLGDETDIDDPQFLACMQAAMYETVFPAPDEGGELRVSYPLEFEPG